MATPTEQDAADEAGLVARSLRQDHEAFGQLVERYAGVVINLAYRMVGDRAQAEDLAQEAFLAAFKALPTFRAESKFSTWLYRIATNKCTDWLRTKRPGQGPQDVDIEETLDDRVVEERTPERMLAQQQVAEQLHRAIQRLPPLYRQAFHDYLAAHGMNLGDAEPYTYGDPAPDPIAMPRSPATKVQNVESPNAQW